jgi:hypothetical protein
VNGYIREASGEAPTDQSRREGSWQESRQMSQGSRRDGGVLPWALVQCSSGWDQGCTQADISGGSFGGGGGTIKGGGGGSMLSGGGY